MARSNFPTCGRRSFAAGVISWLVHDERRESEPIVEGGSLGHADLHAESLPRSPNHQEPIGHFGDYPIESHENDYAFDAQALTRQDVKYGWTAYSKVRGPI